MAATCSRSGRAAAVRAHRVAAPSILQTSLRAFVRAFTVRQVRQRDGTDGNPAATETPYQSYGHDGRREPFAGLVTHPALGILDRDAGRPEDLQAVLRRDRDEGLDVGRLGGGRRDHALSGRLGQRTQESRETPGLGAE